jgi:hypothetical protein
MAVGPGIAVDALPGMILPDRGLSSPNGRHLHPASAALKPDICDGKVAKVAKVANFFGIPLAVLSAIRE